MRKYHRWLSIVFGVFVLWIATTGVMSQFAALVANGGFEEEEPEPRVAPPARAGRNALRNDDEQMPAVAPSPSAVAPRFVCPAEMTCRPKSAPDGARAWVGYLHHLHSGEEFGPGGTVISILSGFALLFFAFSGLWMYVSLWRGRTASGARARWFWE